MIGLKNVIQNGNICSNQHHDSIKFFCMKPQEAVHFYTEHKPRHNNPTYNSSFVFGSLNILNNSDYSRNLLKETEYCKNYTTKSRMSLTPAQKIEFAALQKQNWDLSANRSFLSSYGANTLTRN